MEEREYKWLLTKRAYEEIQQAILRTGAVTVTRAVQLNYYYDTADGAYDRRGVTVRVRQKGDRLAGTIKRHVQGTADGLSEEQDFPLSALPGQITLDGRRLTLQGVLVTDRLQTPLAPGIRLCLDENRYLGVTDYELELEYMQGYSTAVDQWKAKVRRYMAESGRQVETAAPPGQNKSARFFAARAAMRRRGMTIGKGGEAYADLLSAADPDDPRDAGPDLQPQQPEPLHRPGDGE